VIFVGTRVFFIALRRNDLAVVGRKWQSFVGAERLRFTT
jgi:hypothetical protein